MPFKGYVICLQSAGIFSACASWIKLLGLTSSDTAVPASPEGARMKVQLLDAGTGTAHSIAVKPVNPRSPVENAGPETCQSWM